STPITTGLRSIHRPSAGFTRPARPRRPVPGAARGSGPAARPENWGEKRRKSAAEEEEEDRANPGRPGGPRQRGAAEEGPHQRPPEARGGVMGA
ncbi:unnamed protein product, partial [Gulo gulo]